MSDRPKPLAPPSKKLPTYNAKTAEEAGKVTIRDWGRSLQSSLRGHILRRRMTRDLVREFGDVIDVRSELKNSLKRQGVKSAFRSNLARGAGLLGRVGAKAVPVVGSIMTGLAIGKVGAEAEKALKAHRHAERAKVHTELYYRDVPTATRTRKENRRKRERKEAFKLFQR